MSSIGDDIEEEYWNDPHVKDDTYPDDDVHMEESVYLDDTGRESERDYRQRAEPWIQNQDVRMSGGLQDRDFDATPSEDPRAHVGEQPVHSEPQDPEQGQGSQTGTHQGEQQVEPQHPVGQSATQGSPSRRPGKPENPGESTKMEYCLLNPVKENEEKDVWVSRISLGGWLTQDDGKAIDQKKTIECFKTAYNDHGINFFDCDERPGTGEAQTALGKAIKELELPREYLVISTRVHSGLCCGQLACHRCYGKPEAWDSRLYMTEEHIRGSIDLALERMQLKYIDIVYADQPRGKSASVEDIMEIFTRVIGEGKIKY